MTPKITVTPEKSTQEGALDGFKVECICGFSVRCSFESIARDYVTDHYRWHAEIKRNSKRGNK